MRIAELDDSVRHDYGELPEGNFQIEFKSKVGFVAYVRTGKYTYKSVIDLKGVLK